MSDESAKSARQRLWLLLALVPLAAGTLWLAYSSAAIQTASITADGSYVVTATLMSQNPRQWEVGRMDLRTGQTLRMRRMLDSPPYVFSTDNRWLASTEEDGQLTSLSLIHIDDFSEEPVPDVSLWKSAPELLRDRRLIGLDHDGNVRLVDLGAGSDERYPLPPTNARRSAIPLKSPDRVLVLEPPAGGGADKWRLISLTGPIEQLAEWNSTQYWFSEHDEFLFVFNSDVNRIEMLSLEDGSVVGEYDLEPLSQQIRAWMLVRILPQRKTIAILDKSQNRYLLYDLERQRVVVALPADIASGQISKDESFMIVAQGSNGVGAFDLKSRSMRWMHQDWHILRAVELSPHEGQMITVFRNGAVKVFDANTGEVLRTYGNQAAASLFFGGVLVGFVVWCVLWIRAGVRLKVWPFLEAVTLNGLLAAAFILRVNLSGSMLSSFRITYQAAQWLLASWLVLLMCWVVFGKTRWSLRILAPLLGIAGMIVLVLTNLRGTQLGVWILGVCAFGVAIFCGLLFGLLRRWEFVASRDDAVSDAISSVRQNIPLRDLFLITAAVATLLAVVRLVTPHMIAAQEAIILALIAIAVSLTGAAATWAGLSPRVWFLRLLLLIVIVVAAGSLLPTAVPLYRNWEVARFIATSQAYLVLFTLGTSLVFRAHGWRLRRELEPKPYRD